MLTVKNANDFIFKKEQRKRSMIFILRMVCLAEHLQGRMFQHYYGVILTFHIKYILVKISNELHLKVITKNLISSWKRTCKSIAWNSKDFTKIGENHFSKFQWTAESLENQIKYTR